MPSKNSGLGPKWVVRQEEILEALKQERKKVNRLLEDLKPTINGSFLIEEQAQEVYNAVNTWLRVYQSLVLLTAVIDSPDTYDVHSYVKGAEKCPDYIILDNPKDLCLDHSHAVPAWSLGDTGEEGWLDSVSSDDSLKKIFKNNFDKNLLESDIQYLSDNSITDALTQATDDGPLLQRFLDECNKLDLISKLKKFDSETCLDACCKSASEIKLVEVNGNKTQYKANITQYVEQALNLIIELWSEDIDSRLIEVYGWLEETKNKPENFGAWLGTKHQDSQVDWLARSLTASKDTKLVVVGMKAMLQVNIKTFGFVYDRCFVSGSSTPYSALNALIDDLTNRIPDKYRNQWHNLISATYGAIVWQIFHQVTPAVKRIQTLIERG